MGAPYPNVIPEAFALNAGGGFINTIPLTTATPGLASYDQGFPPLTMTPEVSGGVPPFGQDFNGILFMLSSHTVFQQSGQPYVFSSTVATDIGGYAVGTLLGRADGTGFWINTAANNSTDPDAGGAGWVPAFNYGYAAVAGLSNTNHTLTPTEYSKPVIVLTGLLTGNIAIIFPAFLQSWLVVNATSGAFTVTARTAGGTGVVIPTGGFAAPVGVYGDGTNLYPTVSPLAVPIDQAPNPLTIAERDNTGGLASTRFNQNSSLENPAVGSVFVQNVAADGNLRKISLVNFEAQLLLQNIGGSLTTAQTPTAPTTNCRFSGPTGAIVKLKGKACTVTRVSAGTYNVAFTTPMPDNNYGVLFGSSAGNGVTAIFSNAMISETVPQTINGFQIWFVGVFGGATYARFDPQTINFSVFD